MAVAQVHGGGVVGVQQRDAALAALVRIVRDDASQDVDRASLVDVNADRIAGDSGVVEAEGGVLGHGDAGEFVRLYETLGERSRSLKQVDTCVVISADLASMEAERGLVAVDPAVNSRPVVRDDGVGDRHRALLEPQGAAITGDLARVAVASRRELIQNAVALDHAVDDRERGLVAGDAHALGLAALRPLAVSAGIMAGVVDGVVGDVTTGERRLAFVAVDSPALGIVHSLPLGEVAGDRAILDQRVASGQVDPAAGGGVLRSIVTVEGGIAGDGARRDRGTAVEDLDSTGITMRVSVGDDQVPDHRGGVLSAVEVEHAAVFVDIAVLSGDGGEQGSIGSYLALNRERLAIRVDLVLVEFSTHTHLADRDGVAQGRGVDRILDRVVVATGWADGQGVAGAHGGGVQAGDGKDRDDQISVHVFLSRATRRDERGSHPSDAIDGWRPEPMESAEIPGNPAP